MAKYFRVGKGPNLVIRPPSEAQIASCNKNVHLQILFCRFIGTRFLLQAILCFACCATWRESIKFCMERIFRIYAET